MQIKSIFQIFKTLQKCNAVISKPFKRCCSKITRVNFNDDLLSISINNITVYI